jgi:hypothetical protein
MALGKINPWGNSHILKTIALGLKRTPKALRCEYSFLW